MGKPNVLVIVESPNKVKKIQQILNQVDQTHNFSVMATVGHLMDLNKAKGSLGIDLENDYQPDYVILSDKKKSNYTT